MNTNIQDIQELQDFKIIRTQDFTLFTNDEFKIFVSKKCIEIMAKRVEHLSKIQGEVLAAIYQEHQERRLKQ